MKKIFSFLLFCLPMLLTAGNAEYHGSLLAAIEENNPRIRAGMLIRALEIPHPGISSRNALNLLNNDFSHGAFDRTLFLRMINLLKKTPADYPLAQLCVHLAGEHQFFPPEYFTAMYGAIMQIDRAALSPDDAFSFIAMTDNFCDHLFYHEKIEECGEFFDHLLPENSKDPDMLQILAGIAVKGDFRARDILPGRETPGDTDKWNLRKQLIAQAINTFEPDNLNDAFDIIRASRLMHLKQTPERLKKFCKRFPSPFWQLIASEVAVNFRRKDVFIPAPEQPSVWDFTYLCALGDFRSAKRMIKKFPADKHNSLKAVMLVKQGKYDDVIRMLDSQTLVINDMHDAAFYPVLTAIQMTQNKHWAGVLAERIAHTCQSEPEKATPQPCNSIGYVAADLDTSLANAEKLIAFALTYDPNNSAYLDSMAWLCFRRKKFADAEKFIERALAGRDTDESSAVLFFHAAEIKLAAGKKNEAAKLFLRGKRCYIPGSDLCVDYLPEQIDNLEKLLR